jgi:hypothetical protein
VKEIAPLPRTAELGIFITACASQLILQLRDPLPASPSPEQIRETFGRFQAAIAAQNQGDPLGKIIHFVTLFSALGSNLPFPTCFPTFLLADVWSRYASPADPAADFAANYDEFTRQAALMAKEWQSRWDEDLSRVLLDNPALAKAPDLDLSHNAFSGFSSLRRLPARLVWSRLRLYTMLNDSSDLIFRLIPEGRRSASSVFSQMYFSCRCVIGTNIKLKRAEALVINIQRNGSRPDMSFDRYASREFARDPTSSLAKSLFHQMVEQFEATPTLLPRFNQPGVPWHVTFRTEAATDAGGPGRDCFTDICQEIMHPSLRLFVPCRNMVSNRGEVRDLLVPDPEPFAPDSLREKMFFYTGIVMAVCYISRLQTPFPLARFVWAALAGLPPTIEDIFEVDDEFHVVMSSIQETQGAKIDEAQWASSYHYMFEIKNSVGNVVELFPGGSQVPVTFERRMEFVERAQKYRLKEFTLQLDALRRGFHTFFPAHVASLFSPWEIDLLCSGSNDCPVAGLRKLCKSNSQADAERLFRLLDKMTPQERIMFIKFTTGRAGLPPPGLEWQDKLDLAFVDAAGPDHKRPLPRAQTCYSKIIIPRYDSDDVYLEKLRASLQHGIDIEDGNPARLWRDVRAFQE